MTTRTEWHAVFNRYTTNGSCPWTVETKRPDGTRVVLASVTGQHGADGNGAQLTPIEARDLTALIVAVPVMRNALRLARVALAKPNDEAQHLARGVLERLDDELARLP